MDNTAERSAYLASLPKKRMGSGVLIRNTAKKILMVQPSYKPFLEIPGGVVEKDESPYATCQREVEEELGLPLPIYNLLCVDYRTPSGMESESIMFVFYGGELNNATLKRIKVDGKEIVDYAFMSLDEIRGKTTDTLYGRIVKGIQAIDNKTSYYLENQSLVPS